MKRTLFEDTLFGGNKASCQTMNCKMGPPQPQGNKQKTSFLPVQKAPEDWQQQHEFYQSTIWVRFGHNKNSVQSHADPASFENKCKKAAIPCVFGRGIGPMAFSPWIDGAASVASLRLFFHSTIFLMCSPVLQRGSLVLCFMHFSGIDFVDASLDSCVDRFFF